jgi:hypothetical protein
MSKAPIEKLPLAARKDSMSLPFFGVLESKCVSAG